MSCLQAGATVLSHLSVFQQSLTQLWSFILNIEKYRQSQSFLQKFLVTFFRQTYEEYGSATFTPKK